jgi:hypothetical protein
MIEVAFNAITTINTQFHPNPPVSSKGASTPEV